MGSCPGADPLNKSGAVLAGCVYAACLSDVFLYGNFGSMLKETLENPLAFRASFAFYAWMGLVGLGCWWLVLGLRCRADGAKFRSIAEAIDSDLGEAAGWAMVRACGFG